MTHSRPFDNLNREILIGCDPIIEDERGIVDDLINALGILRNESYQRSND